MQVRYNLLKTNRAGFGIAPVLYLLGLVGVGAAVLFSGYSQILRSSQTVANNGVTKSDLNAIMTTLAASSKLSADTITLCPPTGPGAGANCSTVPGITSVMTPMAGQSQLPAAQGGGSLQTFVEGSGYTPTEVGVFKAGVGMKQLDTYGHFFVYCRWENPTNPLNNPDPSNPAFMVISAGPNGVINTKCTDTVASGDDQMMRWNVSVAVNRAAVWQATVDNNGNTTQVEFGKTGSQLTVDANGNISTPGNLTVLGSSTMDNSLYAVAGLYTGPPASPTFSVDTAGDVSANGTLGVMGNTTVAGTLGVTGASTLGQVSANAATVHSLVSTTTANVGTNLGVTGSATIGANLNATSGINVGAVGSPTLTVDALGNIATTNGNFVTTNGAVSSNQLTVVGTSMLGETTATTLSATTLGVSSATTLLGSVALGSTGQLNISPTGVISAKSGTVITTSGLSAGATSVSSLSVGSGMNIGGDITSAANANFAGTVTAAQFNGPLNGTVAATNITGTVALANGGTGYSATSNIDLLTYLGATNASNLSSGVLSSGLFGGNSIPGAAIETGTVTGTQLSATGIGNGTYAGFQINADGRVYSFTPQNTSQLNDGNGDTVGVSSSGVQIMNAGTVTDSFNSLGWLGVGTATPRADIDVAAFKGAIMLPVGSTSDRPSGTAVYNGMIRYSSDNKNLEVYANDTWMALVSTAFGSGITSGVYLGTTAANTNPQRGADMSTGLYTAGPGDVDVSSGGTQIAEFNSGGFNIITGNVGIGTTSPSANLQVRPNTNQNFYVGPAAALGTGITLTATNDANTVTQPLQINASLFDLNGGNVGIGTTSPGARLDVQGGNFNVSGSASATGLYITNSLPVAHFTSSAANPDDGSIMGELAFNSAASLPSTFASISAKRVNTYADDNTALVFSTSGGFFGTGTNQERMRIDQLGNVGIGSASPMVSLDLSQKADAVALPVGTSGTRPGATNVANGMIRYNLTNGKFEGYQQNAWQDILTTGGLGSFIYLGSSSTIPNPEASSTDTMTGLYTAGPGKVDFTSMGTQTVEISTSGLNVLIGNLGVGTSTPVYKADINDGTAGLALNLTDTLGVGYTQMRYTGTGNVWQTGVGNASETGFGVANKYFIFDNTANAMRLVIDTSGNVGIGTTSPGSKLDVNGSASIGFANGYPAPANGLQVYGMAKLGNGSANYTSITGGTTGNAPVIMSAGSDTDVALTLNTTGGGALNLKTAGAGNVIIAPTSGNTNISTGKLGIGSATPQASLDLSQKTDSIILPQSATDSPSVNGAIRYNSGAMPAVKAYVNNSWVALLTSSSALGSNIVLGTSVTVPNPYASATDTQTGLYTAGAGKVDVTSAGTQIAEFNSGGLNVLSGSVGIGTASPSSALEVNGNITLKTSATTYGPALIITSSGSGGRNWQMISNQTLNGGGTGSFVLYDSTDNLTPLVLTDTGTVGVYSSSPQSTLSVGGGVAIGTTYAGTNAAGSNNLIVQGSVGIGSATPIVSLDLSQKSDAVALPVGTSGTRPTTGNVSNGMLRYNVTNGKFEGYQQNTWQDILTTGGLGSFIYLGTSVTVPNPEASASDTQTGFYTTGAGKIDVTIAGAQKAEFNATGLQLVPGVIYPVTDSTAAIQINKANGTSNVMSVDTTNGRVGIGTTSPIGQLNVQQSTYGSNQVVISDGVTGTPPTYPSSFAPAFTVQTSETVGSRPLFFGYNNSGSWGSYMTVGACSNFNIMCLDLGSGTTTYTALSNNGSSLSIGGAYGYGSDGSFSNIYFANSGNTIFTSGNVGIGATSPNSMLEIGTNVGFTGRRLRLLGYANTAGTDANLEIGDGGSVYWRMARNSSNTFQTDMSGNWAINGGNVGIGTTSPGALIDIGSTGGGTLGTLRLEGNTSGYVQLQPAAAAGSWTMTLPTSSGTSGYILQTNGSGVTTWVAPGTGAQIILGTSVTVPNPYASASDTQTGLYTAGAGKVDVTSAGTQIAEVNSSGLNVINGAVGIGTTTVGTNAKLAVNGGLTVGTYASNATATTSGNIITSGSVGIGTANPAFPLEAAGANIAAANLLNLYNNASNAGASATLRFTISGTSDSSSTNAQIAGIRTQSSPGTTAIAFSTSNGSTVSEMMRLDSTGNLGIGTTSPGALIDIGSTGGGTLGTLRLEGNTSGYVQLQPAAAAGSWTMTLPTSGGTSGYMLQTNGSGVTTWVAPGTGAQIILGTSVTVPNPYASASDTQTGFYTAGAGKVDVTVAGTKTIEWSSTGEYIAQGGIGIGTATLGTNTKLAVNGGATFGTYASSATATTSGNIITSGSVGIGTTGPLSILEVANGGWLGGFNSVNLAGSAFGYGTYGIGFNAIRSAAGSNWNIGTDTAHNGGAAVDADLSGNIRFFTVPNTGGTVQTLTDAQMLADQRMVLTYNGYVGIGTATPGSKLDVNGNAAIGYGNGVAAPSNGMIVSGNVGIGTTSPNALIDIGSTGGGTLGTLRLEGNTSGYVQLQPAAAAGSWTMTLPTSGGTSGYVLQTNGSGVTTWAAPGAGAQIVLGTSVTIPNPYASASDTQTGLYTAGAGKVDFTSAGTQIAEVNGSGLNVITGAVGIGTTTVGTNAKLAVNGGLTVGTYASNATATSSGNIITSGSVGIGTTAPYSALDVNGIIAADGSSAITANPPTVGTNQGWKIGLFGTQYALGVTSNTMALLANPWVSLFAWGTNPAANATSTVPDTAAKINFNTANGNGLFSGSVGIGTTLPGTNASLAVNGGLTVGTYASNATAAPSNGLLVSGNVGINQGSPVSLFEVASGGFRFGFSNSTGSGLNYGTNGIGFNVVRNGTSSSWNLGTDTGHDGGAFVDSDVSGNMRFFTVASIGTTTQNLTDVQMLADQRMVITNVGNVGIGSTVPIVSLDLSQKSDAIALPVGTSGTRPTTGNVSNGMLRYNVTNGKFEGYQQNTWQDILTTGGLGSTIYLGTSVSVPNPEASASDTQTGFYTTGVGKVDVTIAGTKTVEWSSLGEYIAQGSIGIGTATPGSKLDINGNASIGYANGVAAPTGGLLVSGNVGIGTAAPQGNLDIAGVGGGAISNGGGQTSLLYLHSTSSYAGESFGAPAGQSVFLEYLQGTTKYGYLGYDTSGKFGLEAFQNGSLYLGAENSNTGADLVIQHGGNVGIGTASPAQKLEVNGSTQVDASVISPLYTTLAGAALAINTGAAATTTATGNAITITGGAGGSTSGAGGLVTITGGSSTSGTSGGITLQTPAPPSGNSGAITLATANVFGTGNSGGNILLMPGTGTGAGSAGNVGIGTAAPSSTLHAYSGGVFGPMITVENGDPSVNAPYYGGGIFFKRTGAANSIMLADELDYSDSVSFIKTPAVANGNATRLMTITQAGNVGIGTVQPSNPLDVYGAVAIGTSYAGVSTAPTNGMIVQGNVGIGTTTPGNKLDVNGAVSVGYGTGVAAPSNGLAVKGNIGIGTTTANALIDIGSTGGGTLGTLRLEGNTSGYVQLQPAAVAGSWTMTLPTTAGTSGYVLQTNGSGVTSWVAAGSGAQIVLGTSVTVPNPYASASDTQTGLYTAGAGKVDFTSAGTQIAEINGSGLNVITGAVGIGTTTVGTNAKLAVSGGATFGTYASSATATTSGNIITSGSVGIGTATPASSLDIYGNAAIGYGNGVAAPTGGLLVSGNVGIGTASPGAKLDIAGGNMQDNGTIRVTGIDNGGAFASGKGVELRYDTGSNDRGSILTYDRSGAVFKNIDITAASIYLLPQGTGSVAIGTTSSVAKLTISAADSAGAINVVNSSGANRFALNPLASGGWTFYDNGTGSWTAGITQLSGNVGIGTAAPGNKLDVNGNAAIGFANGVAAPSTGLAVKGNIGIGTTTANALIDIGSTGGGTLGTLRLEGNTSGYVQLQPAAAAGSWTMTLPTSGGSSGYMLQTNGSGVTSWVSPGTGAQIILGTSVTVPNPYASASDTQTGFYTAGAGKVDVTSAGTQIAEWSSNGEYIATGGIGIGTATLGTNAKLAVNGGLTVGTYASNATATSSGNIIASGSVGIGTASPTAALNIYGANANAATGTPLFRISDTNFSGSYLAVDNGAGANDYRIVSSSTGTPKNIEFQTGANGYQFVLNTNGNVGIGTTAPTYALQLNSGDFGIVNSSNPAFVLSNNNGGFTDFGMATSAASFSNISVTNDSVFKAVGSPSGGSLILSDQNSTGSIEFATGSNAGNDTLKMIITNIGNVGIGTTSPGALIDIGSTGGGTLGTLRLEGNTSGYVQLQPAAAAGSWTMTLPTSGGTSGYVLTTNGSGVTSWVAAGSGAQIVLGTSVTVPNPYASASDTQTGFYTAGAGKVDVTSAGTQVAEFNSSGLGLGTATLGTNAKLAVNGGLTVGTYASSATATTSGNIIASGNVGIGTAVPLATLDVNGTSRVIGITTPSSGAGLEFQYGSSTGYILAYDRGASAYKTLNLRGSPLLLNGGGEGNVGIGTSSPGALIDIGSTGGGTLGTLRLEGNTSGYVQLQPAAAAGSWTMTLPTSGGTSGYVLTTNGSGVTSWVAAGSGAQIILGTSVTVPNPYASASDTQTGFYTAGAGKVDVTSAGTQVAEWSSNGEYIATGGIGIGTATLGTNAKLAVNGGLTVGTYASNATATSSGNIITSGSVGIGTSSPNALIDIGSTGGGTLGTLRLEGNTSGYVQLQPAAAAGSWTMTLPTSGGTSGYVLTTNGSGVTSWVAAGSGAQIVLGTSVTVPNPYASASDTQTGFYTAGAGKVDVTSAGTQIAEVNGSGLNVITGAVGIGTTTAGTNAKLAVNGGLTVGTYASNATATTSGNIITSGNVGIGTTAPQAPLQVFNNQNANTVVDVTNSSTGAYARSLIIIGQDTAANATGFGYTNSNASFGSSYADLAPSSGLVYAGASATNGLNISAIASNAPITFFTSGEASSNQRMIITGTGNVGIGAAAPNVLLKVGNGDNNFANFSFNNTTIPQSNFGLTLGANETGGSGESNFWNGYVTALRSFDFRQVTVANTSANTLMSIYANGGISIGTGYAATQSTANGAIIQGNVGIGTTSPNALIDIGSTGGGTLGTLRLEGNTSGYVQLQPAAAAGSWTMTLPTSGGTSGYVLTTNGSGVTSWVAAGSGAQIVLGTSVTVPNPYASASDTQTGFYTAGAGKVDVTSAGTQVAEFNSSGLGLGTATLGTNAKLAVNGGLTVGTYASSATATTSGNIITSGNIGVGTATPGSKLDVNGNAAIGYGNGVAAPSNGMIVSGNVGIGTTSPAALLDVEGGAAPGTYSSGSGINLIAQNGGVNATSGGVTLQTGGCAGGCTAGSINLNIGGSSTNVMLTPSYFMSNRAMGAVNGTLTNGAISPPWSAWLSTGDANNQFSALGFNGYWAADNFYTLRSGYNGGSMINGDSYGNMGFYALSSTGSGTQTVTVSSMTSTMYIKSNGYVGIGTTSPNALIDIGSTGGGTLGTLRLEGNTSGYVQLQPAAAAGSWTMTLPTSGGTSGYVLTTNGSGVTSWVAAGSGAQIVLGTSVTVPNPYASASDTQTGFYTAGAGKVDVTSAGTQVAEFNSSGLGLGTATLGTNAKLAVNGGLTVGTYASSATATTSGNIITSGNIGVGTATPGSKLDVNGNAAIGYGNGVAAPSNGMIVSGNVGIGTAAPGSTLQINGNAAIGYSTSTSAPSNGLQVAGNITIDPVGSSTASPRTFGFSSFNSGQAARLQLPDGSNAIQNAYGDRLQLYSYWGMEIRGSQQNNSPPSFDTGVASDASLSVYGTTGNSGNILNLNNNAGTTLDVVTGTGSVGIGTTSPYFPLHIVSTLQNGTVTEEIQNTYGGANANTQLFLGTRVTPGDTNVGASIYASRTDAVTPGDTDLLFKNSAGTTLNTNMVIKATGNVGIGTTAPATGVKLDVGGPVKVAGTGSETCGGATVGTMRYNSAGGYMEICQ